MEIRIFMTIEFLSLLIFMWALYYDYTNQTTTRYSDSGWTRHYTIPVKVRKVTSFASYFAGSLCIAGILYLIWTF